MLRGDVDANMLDNDKYARFKPELLRQEYLRAMPKLGI
jgi:hypothetical protein